MPFYNSFLIFRALIGTFENAVHVLSVWYIFSIETKIEEKRDNYDGKNLCQLGLSD